MLCRPETGYCIRQNVKGVGGGEGGGGETKIVLNRTKTVYIARCCKTNKTATTKLTKRERETEGKIKSCYVDPRRCIACIF